MFNRITVVCVGNICRSPFGEAVLKDILPKKTILSAGIATNKSGLSGKPANPSASSLASDLGFSLEAHKAQQLTGELCKDSDLILVMEKGHARVVSEISPESTGKTMLFSHWYNKEDIPDPYQKSEEAFKHAFRLILDSAKEWSKKLL